MEKILVINLWRNFFSLSKFKGGNLNFSMNGNITDYDGLFYITDTIIVDYKMLNNILAFVNTVPSLVNVLSAWIQ